MTLEHHDLSETQSALCRDIYNLIASVQNACTPIEVAALLAQVMGFVACCITPPIDEEEFRELIKRNMELGGDNFKRALKQGEVIMTTEPGHA